MPLNELEPILNKDAIIATYPAEHLRKHPAVVEEVYRAHARTHISLGDTAHYVDIIFKWVGGGNKGAFIGGVVGEHGHGKTSFQVHVWHESANRGILAVPPFSWDRESDIIEGAAAWVDYVLSRHDLDVAREADLIYKTFREQSFQEVAERTAQKTGKSVEEVLISLREVREHGGAIVDTSVSPERVLDYFEAVAGVIQKAGFRGFLVLLDEPEVAMRGLGSDKVSQILFDLANGLLQRQGDFGLFISLPERFLATATRLFPALTARLQDRNCLPRLRNIYGSDFAQVLWERFVSAFHLGVEEAGILPAGSLRAVGQVSSSERGDLSYGPRTVVSAFRRAVSRYVETGTPYSPFNFVEDCLRDEIRVTHNYVTKVQSILDAADAHGLDRHALKILAAFPQGISVAEAATMGIDEQDIEAARRARVLYRRGNVVGLMGLQADPGQGPDADELRDAIDEILGEFAPRATAFMHARDAFIKYVVPKVFEERKGQQLLGWDVKRPWKAISNEVKIAELEGAFRETERDFPSRRVFVAIGPSDYEIPSSAVTKDRSDSGPDLILQVCLRWSRETPLPDALVSISPGDPAQQVPGAVRITLDLAGEPISAVPSVLEELADKELLTPLGILNLMNEIDRRSLSKEFKLTWEAMREPLVREVMARLFMAPSLRAQAEGITQLQISAGAQVLVGSIILWILRNRYGDYSTLIRQPLWTRAVDNYIRALDLQEIPPAAKRGREPWVAPTQTVARALNSNPMNLSDAFAPYANVISIKKLAGRDGDTEVVFRLHPLEQRIQDMITGMQQERRLKLPEGETNWWQYAEDVAPVLLVAGYSDQEIAKIFEIGRARGTFDFGLDRQKRVVYCLPLDVEQMKSHLREKLAALKQECDALRFIPQYTTRFNFDAVSAEIESMQDLEQSDSLATRINKEFEKNHSALPTYRDRFIEDLKTAGTVVQRVKQLLSESRQIAGLQTPPTGVSKWLADLSQYIIFNLQAEVKEIRKICGEVGTEVEKSAAQLSGGQFGYPLEKIQALQDAWNMLQAMSEKAKNAEALSRDLFRLLDDYDHWRRLLSKSDAAHNDLLELKKESAHVAKADELLLVLQGIWSDISHHLKTRNLKGLGSYQQFDDKIERVTDDRRKYVSELKQVFDQKKEQLNRLLATIGVPEGARCAERFDHMDPAGSTVRLTEQAVSHLRGTVSQELDDLLGQRRELLYTRDILKWVSAGQAEPLLIKIQTGCDTLQSVAGQVDTQWIAGRKLSEDGALDQDASFVHSSLTEAREIIRTARQLIRSSRPEESAELGSAAMELLELVPANETVNLKQLILNMMARGRDSQEVLDFALRGLTELFRHDKVQIKVEMPRK